MKTISQTFTTDSGEIFTVTRKRFKKIKHNNGMWLHPTSFKYSFARSIIVGEITRQDIYFYNNPIFEF